MQDSYIFAIFARNKKTNIYGLTCTELKQFLTWRQKYIFLSLFYKTTNIKQDESKS